MKTTDAGETWFDLPGLSPEGANAYYNKGSHALFSEGTDPVDGTADGAISWDEGLTWQHHAKPCYLGHFAFINADTGIQGHPGLLGNLIRTTNGGLGWTNIWTDSLFWNPLAIEGTQTFFGVTLYGGVFRSDDAGSTWRYLSTVPFQQRNFPQIWENPYYSQSGTITGDMNDLFTLNADGCFHSTDQGLTWKSLCGPYSGGILHQQAFFARNHIVFVGSNENYTPTTNQILWRLNLDSLRYFDAGVKLSAPFGIAPDARLRIDITTDTNSFIGIDSVHLILRYDDPFDLHRLSIPSGWRVLDSASNGHAFDLWITSDAQPLPNNLLTFIFRTTLEKSSAKIYLDSVNFYGKRLNCDCSALSFNGPDSVTINFAGCGDSMMVEFMRTGSLVHIDRIVPNPAADQVRAEGSGLTVEGLQVYDVMGRLVSVPVTFGQRQNTTLQPPPLAEEGEIELDVRALPEGVYYLRAGQASARFEILR